MVNIWEKIKREAKLLPRTLKYLPGEMVKTAAKIPVPGKELAKGLGYTIAKPFVSKIARDVQQTTSQFQTTLLNEYRKARAEGNTEKQKRLEKTLKDFKFTNVMAEVMAETPTSRQVIASAGELALLATIGYKPYLQTGKLTYGKELKQVGQIYKTFKGIQQAEKLAQMGKIGKIGERLVKPVVKQAIIGAGFFGTMKATERDATIKDIIKAAEKGAIIAGTITVAAIGLGEAVGLAQRKLGPPLAEKWQRAMRTLERTATGKTKAGQPYLNPEIVKHTQTDLAMRLEKLSNRPDLAQKIRKIRLPEKVYSVDELDYLIKNAFTRKDFASAPNLPGYLSNRIEQLRGMQKVPKEYVGMFVGSQIDKTLSHIGEQTTFKQKAAQVALKGIETVRKTEARLIDRFASGKRIEARISQMKGKPLSETEKIYRDMRLFTAASDASAEKKVLDLMDKIGKFDDPTKRKALAWMTQLDFIDRARLGQKVAGNQNLDDLVLGLKKLSQEIGPDDMKNVAKIRQAVYTHNLNLLQERVDAGLISKEFRDVLLRTHPNYIRHDVILAADERIAQGLSSSLNVPKTDIMKAIGSAKNIADPLEATIGGTQIATRVIEKNKILTNFVKAQEQYNLFPGMEKVYQTIKTEEGFRKVAVSANFKPKTGFEVISLFKNGVRETWQVPADIGIAIRNLDAPITPGWWHVLTTPQKLLKKGATQYNLSFTLPNKFRDKQTAALTARGFIESMAQKTGVNPQTVNLSSKEIKELYKISGGYGASIFREGESKILTDLEKTGMSKTLSSANPAKIINTINNRVETSTRLEVFKQALQRGLSPKDAAFVSREATIDFAKMGSWMKPLNQAIPFLNARVQGFINLPRAMVANPEVFARMQMYTAVYPTLALHEYNRRFDSYANISPYMKNKYWIIMTGETDGIDSYTGNPIKVPQFVSIMKGEGQSLVSGPIQYYLEKADGIDFRKTSEMLADTLGSASPLEFQTWDGGNLWLSLAAQMGPAVSIPAGLAAGKVPYTGMPMVPESRKQAEPYMQFAKYTPEVTKEIGKILNVSPAEIDFIISSFGGLPQDMQRAVDIAYNVVRDGKLGGNSISETPWGALTQTPMIRRFIRESAERGYEKEFRYQQKEEIQKGLETEKLKIYDKAEEIWQEMNKKETKEDKLNYLNSFGGEITPEIRKRITYLKKHRQTVESLKPTDSVELRARYILQRLDEMKEMEISKEDRVKFLDELETNRILTQKVKEMIFQIQHE